MSKDKVSALEEVSNLIALAQEALVSDEQTGTEEFFVPIESYLKEMAAWTEGFDASSVAEAQKEELRGLIEQLDQLHASVIKKTSAFRAGITEQLSETRKRSEALKAYIDTIPSRITVAGRRKG